MKILIVEDEGIIANNLADTLRRSGYEIAGFASSGENALEKVGTLKPDLVLMDINLNGKMDGIEAAAKIRSEFFLPVIFLTAYATRDVLDRAKQTHPFGYLVKPIRQADLVSAIEIAVFKHQMEGKLRQREAWLSTTLRCAGEGVIVTDAAGRIEFLNDLSKRILGIRDRDVVGQKFCDAVQLQNRFTGNPAGDLIQLAILQGSTMSIGSDLILLDEFQQEVNLEGEVALSETEGLVVGTVFTVRDVTIRNYQENQQQQELGTMACARLSGALSTELRNVLQRSAGAADDSAHHIGPISRLVAQLDAVRRRDASFPCTLNLNALISETCAELGAYIPANTELTFHPEPALYRIYADPVALKKAILSLVLHSRDSMPAGGTIHLVTRNCAVERRSNTGDAKNYVRLTVSNTSGMMAPEQANQLFEPFSGADPSEDKLDLRLFLVHQIIGSAGGSIRANAVLSGGTSFEILLPRRADREAYLSTPISMETQQEGAAILLLQADHAVSSLILGRLENAGYEALGAHDLNEALEWMTIYPAAIAMLIADLDLCHMSGPALAQHVLTQHPGIRIVITGDLAVDPAVTKMWLDRGARFLEKPFRLETLLGLVNQMLSDNYPSATPVGPAPEITFPLT